MSNEKRDLRVNDGASDIRADTPRARIPPESLRDLSMEELKRTERRLVRTLDARLILPLIIIYIMNYLDRNAIAAAKVAGIEDDLGLTDSQYQTSVSILFVGYGLPTPMLGPQ